MERARRARLLCMARPAVRTGVGRRTGAGGRSVPDDADLAHARPGPRRGQRRPRAIGDRRLSLVHRLGTRHDDLARRADARAPAAWTRHATSCARSRYHVRDGLIPNMFPEGGKEGLYHTADATLWFFHAARSLPSATRATTCCCANCCRRCGESSTRIARARASASASIRPTACCGRAPRAISSRGWMPRSTAGWSRRAVARRSRSTRSGTTPCRLLAGWLRDGEHDADAADSPSYAAQVRASFNSALLERRQPATCSTSWTAKRATTRRAAPTRSSP